MADSQKKTISTAVRQIRPPPVSQHLREFASRPDAWAVLARNMIPVVGIYGFGWSAALAVFNYWFDGLTALAAIVAALIPRALRETQPKSAGAVSAATNIVRGVVTWIFLVGIVGLPYWIVLIPLHESVARRSTAPRTRAFSGALVHLWLAGGKSFLEIVPHGLRHDARQGSEATGTLGYLSADPAGAGHVYDGRARARFHSGAANGAAAELS